jgi:hypothetical protein
MGDLLARVKERGDCPVRTAMGDHGRSPGITPPGTLRSAWLGGLMAPLSLGLRAESRM